MLEVSALYIYPIKSLGGIPVGTATLTDRGFAYDRCWMLVDSNNNFLTAREFPEMALIRTDYTSCVDALAEHLGKPSAPLLPKS